MFDAIQSDRVEVVRTTRKITLQPNEAKTITCLVLKIGDAEPALTEPTEKAMSAKIFTLELSELINSSYTCVVMQYISQSCDIAYTSRSLSFGSNEKAE